MYPTSREPSVLGRKRAQVASAVRVAMPAVVSLGLLALLLPVGLGSTVGAAFTLGAAAVLIALVACGIERTAVGLLALGFVLAPMNDVRPVAALTFVTMSDVFLVVSFGLLVPILIAKGFQAQPLFLIGVSGVVTVGLITSLASAEPLQSLNGLLRLVVGALILPAIFMLWRPRREVVVAFAGAYVVGNCISVAQAVIGGVSSIEGRYIGLTRHPNILGLCSMLALMLLPFLLQELPKWCAWLVVGAGAVCGYGIWISGSRAAFLVGATMLVVYLVLSRSIERALLFFGLSIIPVYLVGQTLSSGEESTNIIGRLAGGGSATGSDLAREQLAREAIDRFFASPIIGVGFGDVLEAHNIYLQVAAAVGVVGLIFYLALIASVALQPFMLEARYRLLALPALSYAMIGLITPLLWDRYIWCVLALPFLLSLPGKPAGASDSPPPRSVSLEGTR